jgi:hypothetical protein
VFYWIYDIPTPTLAVIMAVLFVGYFWAGCILVRPILRLFVRARTGTNEIVGHVLSCYCVFYGLLLGLIAVAVYQNFTAVEMDVAREATALNALYQDASAYREPYGQNLRWILRDYCRHVIKYEWPLQQKGTVPESGRTRLASFQEKLLAFQPQTPGEEIVHAETLHQFNVFLEHRQMRLQSVKTGIPSVMWYVVIVGVIINIAMVWLFEMQFITQLFLGGLLAFFLGTMIFLIAAMDNPFRGEVCVSPEPFVTIHKVMLED